jgi:hypothetical protein
MLTHGLQRSIRQLVEHGKLFLPRRLQRKSSMSAQKKSSERKKEIEKDLKNKGSFYKKDYEKNLRKKK